MVSNEKLNFTCHLEKEETFESLLQLNHRMAASNIMIHEIPVATEEMAIIGDLLLIKIENDLKIYKYDEHMTLNLVNTYGLSSLTFLGRYLTTDARKLMNKIILIMAQKKYKLSEIEKLVFEKVKMLCFDKIKSVKYGKEYIKVCYTNDVCLFLNSSLEVINKTDQELYQLEQYDETLTVVPEKIFTKIKLGDFILVKKRLGKIIDYDITENKIFLLKKDSIVLITLQ